MVDSLLNDPNLRFVFVGGKGGVGKTTSSSALATQLSKQRRVLLVSTDPAHSLSDAFRMGFSAEPTRVAFPDDEASEGSLHVMEIDPSETMKGELGNWATLATELSGTNDSLLEKVQGLQDWLSGIPGIDEATALSQSVKHIESGLYDIIVFDTAPTGHTLKLLQLPAILDMGLQKLEGWQSTIWGYWEVLKSTAQQKEDKVNAAKAEIAEKLKEYKRGIQKVNRMLTDCERTKFVVVCISEYLSVSESKRLLTELGKCRVSCSHVIVNQLVGEGSFLEGDEMAALDACFQGLTDLPPALRRKVQQACKLTSSRRGIQKKYLQDLKACEEVKKVNNGLDAVIVEVPLLPTEVTGPPAILNFSRLLRAKDAEAGGDRSIDPNLGGALYDDEKAAGPPRLGSLVLIKGLGKAPQYNGLQGRVFALPEAGKERYAVKLRFEGAEKSLQLLAKNFDVLKTEEEAPATTPEGKRQRQEPGGGVSAEKVDKAKKLLDDPEIQKLIAQIGPRAEEAVQNCVKNPMAVMQYLGDPELQPLVSLAMGKFMGAGGSGAGGF